MGGSCDLTYGLEPLGGKSTGTTSEATRMRQAEDAGLLSPIRQSGLERHAIQKRALWGLNLLTFYVARRFIFEMYIV